MIRVKRLVLAIIVVGFVLFIGYSIYLFFHPLLWLSSGELIKTSKAPRGKWAIKLYYINPGAMAPDGYRAEAVDLEKKKDRRNIYHDIGVPMPKIKWLGPTVVQIGGHALDVRSDSYEPPIW